MKLTALPLRETPWQIEFSDGTPYVTNPTNQTLNLDEVEIYRWQICSDQAVKFERFGFNMPGDPVFFGTLSAQGWTPARWLDSASLCQTHDEFWEVTSNSLIALQLAGETEVTLIGAGSFVVSEGTIRLSRRPGARAELTFSLIMDGYSLEPGARLKLDDAVVWTRPELTGALREWAQLHARQSGARFPEKIPTGWNDWQYYRNHKTQEDILANLAGLSELKKQGFPLEFLQIDGGYCLHLSEWEVPKPGFELGMAKISQLVRDAGFQFGLWFAPYIQNVQTQVVATHPEWLLRDAQGEPVTLGQSNVGASVLIDYTVPGALAWLKSRIRLLVDQYQVTWIKLDGPNYALYRRGVLHNRQQTVHQMFQNTFKAIREASGAVLVEGEGSMSAALGTVELHRVQTDNHPRWYRDQDRRQPYAPRVYGKELQMSFLHQIWWCNHRENVILRDYASPYCWECESDPASSYVEPQFNSNEWRTQLVAAAIAPGGLLLTDPLPELIQRPELLKWAARLLPVCSLSPEVLDAFPADGTYPGTYLAEVRHASEKYHLLALFNWQDQSREVCAPLERLKWDNSGYWCWDFFTHQAQLLQEQKISLLLPSHGATLLALRPMQNHPQLLGTDIHLTMGGAELESWGWDASQQAFKIVVKPTPLASGQLFFAVPEEWKMARIEASCHWHWNDFNARFPILEFAPSQQGEVEFELFFKR